MTVVEWSRRRTSGRLGVATGPVQPRRNQMETLNNQTLDKELDLEHIARPSEWRGFSFPEKN